MSDNFLNHYAAAHAAGGEDNAYEAFLLGNSRQTRLKLVQHEGTILLVSYTYLVEAICTSHQFLSLIFTNCVITISGRNLLPLIDLLQDEKIKTLQCFREGLFDPPEEGATLIRRIEREHIRDIAGEYAPQKVEREEA